MRMFYDHEEHSGVCDATMSGRCITEDLRELTVDGEVVWMIVF